MKYTDIMQLYNDVKLFTGNYKDRILKPLLINSAPHHNKGLALRTITNILNNRYPKCKQLNTKITISTRKCHIKLIQYYVYIFTTVPFKLTHTE